MNQKPSYEELEGRITELLEQLDHYQSAAAKHQGLFDDFSNGITVIDDTEKRRLEGAHRLEKIRDSLLFESHLDAIYLLSEDGHILDANQAACKSLGRSREDILSLTIKDIDTNYDSASFKSFWSDQPEEQIRLLESTHIRADGSIFPVEVTCIPFMDQGKPLLYGFARDITNRKQVEEQIKHQLTVLTQPEIQVKDFSLIDVLNIETLQHLQDAFSEAFGMPSIIYGPDGKPFTKPSGFTPFCNLLRSTKKGSEACERFNKALMDHLRDNPEPHIRTGCIIRNMVTGTVPIVIQGKHLANWGIGQMIDGELDTDEIRRHARDIGLDEQKLVTAARELKKVDNASFERTVRFIKTLSDQISLLGLNNLRQGREISARMKAEEDLNESKQFLENLTDLAYVADDAANVIWVNRAAEKMTGFLKEEIIGKPFLPLFIDENHPSIMDVYCKTLLGESLENTLTFTSGITCHFTSLPRRSKTGEIIGTFGIARDITDKLHAEEALRDSEDRLKRAQAVAKIGSWEYDIVTGEVWGSEEAFRIYGIERISPSLPLDEVESHIIEAERVNQSLVDLITRNIPYDIEFEITPKNRDGLTVIHSLAELICDANGNPLKVVGVIQDITDLKAREQERLELVAQLEQAQKLESVGRLAGGVAHDFNNMLSIIHGHAEIALDEIEPNHDLYGRLQEIRKAAERSAELTHQLLAFARKQPIAPKVLNLNDTVEEMLNMLRRLIGEDIHLVWLPGKDLWPIKVDPTQINQILANLCVNARDAITNVGEVTIETAALDFDKAYCSAHKGYEPGEFVMLAVHDNGSGIDSEIMANLFEPFFTTKELGKGTGLGLSTVYGIAKQNNGFVDVSSEPDTGTTFKVFFPRFWGKERHVHEEALLEPVGRGHGTILLVEDEPVILEIIQAMLERMGYNVLTASRPGEAIRLAHEYPGVIHLLVTDVVMPEMNGRDLAKNLLSFFPNLKRLFMSGYTADVIAHHGVLDEGVHFIHKPFSMKGLSEEVRKVLERKDEHNE